MTDLDLLATYADGPRIWDAASLIPDVYELERLGLIERVPNRNGAFQLTAKGSALLGSTPLTVGTVVDYHGSHKHGRYVITGHEAPRPDVPEPAVNYPDGVAYIIWPEGMPQKFGLRHHMVSQVRRQSLTPVSIH
jgi:hypothetical protein